MIDERASELAPIPKNVKIWGLVAVVVASIGLAMVTLGGLGENLIFYWTPTEMREAGDKAYGATIRLGGQVKPGSIVKDASGTKLTFEVTDGTTDIPVDASSMPPAMFRENIGVVVEGTLLKSQRFRSDRLMVKHDNEYRAPGEEADAKELMKTTEGLKK